MKTFLFFLGLVALIMIALFFKHRIDEKKGRPDLEFDDTKVATVWDSILVGNWKIHEVDISNDKKWIISSEVTFYGDHQFRLNGTENLYHLYLNDYSIYMTSGGGSTGKWHATSDSSFSLYGSECDFKVTEGVENPTKPLKYFKCDNGFKVSYGFISTLDFKSQINPFSKKDSISITGRSFSQDCNYNIELTRIH